jgi:dolichyl-phosphate-mannose-protein mannosyltransferase
MAKAPWNLQRSSLIPPLLILAVSRVLHFAWLEYPRSVVSDEVHYGRFALAYLRHEFVFDIHPPLGRLIFWAAAWSADLNPNFSFATIGLPFPDTSYLVLRLVPRLAGTLLPLLIYGVAIELGMTRWAALITGLLVATDNALVVISRFALPDVFILLFGYAALWSYLIARRLNSWTWLTAAAIAAGCAASVKWTGLSFLLIIGTLQLVKFLSDHSASSLGKIVILCVVPVAVYFGTFAAQFALLDHSGSGDAYMSSRFQATLTGNAYAQRKDETALGEIGKVVELNVKMYQYASQAIDHPYLSKWYSWPFMKRGIFFWTEPGPTQEASIYLLGNPIIWWASGCAILFLLVTFLAKIPDLIKRTKPRPTGCPELIVIFGYLANMLPFMAVPRGMFLYHYLPALVFAILGIGLVLDRVERKHVLGTILLAASIFGFVYFAPLTYGIPVSKAAMSRMFWFDGWR